MSRARTHLANSLAVQQTLGTNDSLDSIVAGAGLIAEAFRGNHKLLLCGNGGSAADCQHMAAEFVGRLTKEYSRPGLPAIALTTDTSFLTAHSNDVGFDDIFRRQVQALGQAGDVVMGLSTSGNSANIIAAVQYARTQGLGTIGLIGEGGAVASLVDVCIYVPSTTTQYIQEAHIVIVHIICDLVEQLLMVPKQK